MSMLQSFAPLLPTPLPRTWQRQQRPQQPLLPWPLKSKQHQVVLPKYRLDIEDVASAIGVTEESFKWAASVAHEKRRAAALNWMRYHIGQFVWHEVKRLGHDTQWLVQEHVMCVCTTGSTYTNTYDMESDVDLLLITGDWLERSAVLSPDSSTIGSLAHYFGQLQLPCDVHIAYISVDRCHAPVFKLDLTLMGATVRVDLALAIVPASVLSPQTQTRLPDPDEPYLLPKLLELQRRDPQHLNAALDAKSRISLAAYWSCVDLLEAVPDPTKFRICVRFIRLWARRRGIYSQMLGYPGGTAWALLVARACIACDTPETNVAQLISQVFVYWSHYEVYAGQDDVNAMSQVDVTTFELIQREWNRAVYVTSGRRRSPRPNARLRALFSYHADESHVVLRPVFFRERSDFSCFSEVTFVSYTPSSTAARNATMQWRELVKSRLLHGLIEPLRKTPNTHAVLWPIPRILGGEQDSESYTVGIKFTSPSAILHVAQLLDSFQTACNLLARSNTNSCCCCVIVHAAT
jgi:hypothetical protein